MWSPSRSLGLLIACATAAPAAVEVEKIATADACPLAPGVVQVTATAGYARADDTDRRGGARRDATAVVALGVGLVDRVDLAVSAGWADLVDRAADPETGDGPLDLGAAVRWLAFATPEGERWTALALIPTATAPLGRGHDDDAEIPTAGRCWSAGGLVALSGGIDRWSLAADAGWVKAIGDADDRAGVRATWTTDLALGWQATGAVQPEVELNFASDEIDAGAAPWSLTGTAGVLVAIPRGRLGAGVQRTLAERGRDPMTGAVVQVVQDF